MTAPYLDAALTLVAVDDAGTPLPKKKKALRALWIMLRSSIALLVTATVLSVVLDPLTWMLVYHSRAFPWWIDGLFALFELGVALSVFAIVASLRLMTWLQECVAVTGDNKFGWAHGHQRQPVRDGVPPLVDWLHREVQRTSGKDADPSPLTFGDLLSCGLPAGQPPNPGDGTLGVNLRMNTTCLTLNRPFTLPFDPIGAMTFYFKIADFEEFFPDDVAG